MSRKLKKSRNFLSTGIIKKVFVILFVFNNCFWCSDAVYGNNVRIAGEPVVQLNATSDSLSLTFTLSWDHSWRDDFNWDAVWLFVKYKREGSNDAWSHLYLGGSQVGTANLEIDPGNTGNQIVGAFVYPKNKGTFDIAGEQVRLQAPLNGLSASDLTEGKIYFAVTGIEMVLIPYGAYYLGDGEAHHSFHEAYMPERNWIRRNGYQSIECSSVYGGEKFNDTYGLQNAIDNNAGTHFHSAGTTNEWFLIDLGMMKEMRYFTIRTHYAGTSYYLEGSNDTTSWNVLWSGQASDWSQTMSKHVITHPDFYRYYRFRETGNYLVIYDVSLWEEEYPSVYVDSEDAFYSTTSRILTDNLQIPAAYPKGYKGFYVMKYELSQEQYVNFLNMLSYVQQKNRIGNNLDNLQRGDYVFGDPAQPSCRNGIAVFSNKGTSQPVVFGNNLNPAEPFFSEDDGQTLACNYMTGADMLAYLDWSGLRPFSELEYEKMCRTPNRVTAGEYAWNSTVVHSLGGLSGLSSSTVGTENEVPSNLTINVNAGHPSFGPVRCGAFGSSTSTQEQSGSSFYGVMELSGNLGEMYYSVTGGSALNTSSSANEYHGDGTIDNSGNYNVGSYWNRSSDATAFMVRGGSFASADSLLRVSDRSIVKGYDNTNRDSTITFRGGRSISQTIDPGEIEVERDTLCPGEKVVVVGKNDAVAGTDITYVWYVQYPGTTDFERIPDKTGKNLEDFEVVNQNSAAVIYVFKRKAVSFLGESFSNPVSVLVGTVPTDIPSVPSSYNSIVGSSFRLPCINIGSLHSEWITPGNNLLPCDAANVVTHSSADVYQVYFVNEYGCKGTSRNVVVRGYSELSFVPKHAREYLPLGASDDGVYMLDPDGLGGNEPLPVYCNMTNAGGGWMLIVNSLSTTSVTSMYTSGYYNQAYLGNWYKPYKYSDAWINLIAFDMYWTEGRNGCNDISHSYWKAADCIGGGVYSTLNGCGEDPATNCCYKRYSDAALTTDYHEGIYKRCMFDDDRANDAYVIWPYRCGELYVNWGHACSAGGLGAGEYRIWVR